MMTVEDLAERLTTRDPLPSLVPDHPWRDELTNSINALQVHPLVKAGLHLWNDNIDGCHQIAQANPTPEGNYWHAILHRREPDYSNSKYWYRRVGEHPVFGHLRTAYPQWEPFRFVDWCQENGKGEGKKSTPWLEQVQAKEMLHLLDWVMTATSRP